jgi:hypothetical protein
LEKKKKKEKEEGNHPLGHPMAENKIIKDFDPWE